MNWFVIFDTSFSHFDLISGNITIFITVFLFRAKKGFSCQFIQLRFIEDHPGGSVTGDIFSTFSVTLIKVYKYHYRCSKNSPELP